ncbi:MAG: LysR substrate-binding domain-containing protein [Granulosicoccaceae bacterium]
MHTIKQQLPPLDPCVAFDAAARHLSFTRAAQELNLSQAAVSQQIRNLEAFLGVKLFIRANRSVRLSPAGKEFQHSVSGLLRQLASAANDIKAPASRIRLTIAADQSVASMWLMPRLTDFQSKYPDIAVRLIASDEELDCLHPDVHVAIIHGKGDWPSYRAEKLFEEEIFPVCSPAYLADRKTISIERLVDENLLEQDDDHWDWMNWRTWLSHNDMHLPKGYRGFQVNSYPLMIDAARNGHGIALGWRYLVDPLVASGELVMPSDAAVKTGFGYYLVCQNNPAPKTAVTRFCEWAKECQNPPSR